MKNGYWRLLAGVCLLAACGGDLREEKEPDEQLPADGPVVHLERTGDITTTRIDATGEDWIHLDLETGKQVEDGTWDLAFQHFGVISNGGASGSGGVAVAIVSDPFEPMEQAPAVEYLPDLPDGADDDQLADSAFLGGDPWYDYDSTTHTLSPKNRRFVVRTNDGAYFRFEMLDYYDDAGTSGFPTFRWGSVAAPAARPRELAVDAGDHEAWVAVDLRHGAIVEVADPAASGDWDLLFQRTMIRTNGGTSGPGAGAAAIADAASLEAIESPPEEGAFAEDAICPLPGPPGSGETSASPVLLDWYDYDSTTHAVTPKDRRYVIRTAEGGFAKLQIVSYESGLYTLAFAYAADGRFQP